MTQYAHDTIKKRIMCEKRTLKKVLIDIYNVHYKTNNKGVAIEVKLQLQRFYFLKEEKRMGIGQKLQIIDVSKFYGTFQALDRVNLECGAGEFVTILGSSGSGKTTLLKAIAGFEQSSSGIILINNEDVAGKKSYDRNIGMLFQNYALFPHMTIAENIAYPLKLRNVPKAEIKERVKKMIDMVKLTGMEDRYPKQLSGGQQQRVALARAIVYNPPLLLLDEPLGALDKNLRHDMQFEIKRITKELGMTTISVTHDQEEAFSMSDKICIMSHGRIQQFGTPEEIYEHPQNRFVAEFMGTTNIVKIKNITYEILGDTTVVTADTAISDKQFVFSVPTKQVREDVKEAHIAIRPESISVEPKGRDCNTFTAKIQESIYVGECVKIKAIAKQKSLNMTLTVAQYRNLMAKDINELPFYCNQQDITILYE